MEEMYGVASSTTVDYSDKALMTPENLILPADYQSFLISSAQRMPMFGSEDLLSAAAAAMTHEPEANSASEFYRQENVSTLIKAKIASHPGYPRLLEAYIDCQKVGAPPEIASLLDELWRENDLRKRDVVSTCYAADPELDEFMETYCEMLMKYKFELSRPFNEATSFLNKIESQLSKLSTGTSFSTLSVGIVRNAVSADTDNYQRQPKRRLEQSQLESKRDDGAVSSDEDFSAGEIDNQDTSNKREDQDLKDRLLRRFGNHISSLKLEFTKKKKKGKLPKEARQTLLEWWNLHNKWPYPTEGDKFELAKATGLDQKQINNWFINQRKRHWKTDRGHAVFYHG